MSYQVLARKWRPKSFKEMVGQEHVLKALIHSLDSQRLHHAYLFTGTRGVGKTTLGRILARCLNCETGVSSEPCGTCSSCNEISEGRFVDLIEIDAASRTKVEDMRELLENVQYAPTRARFKVYLIDEVHMLTTQSFNALLKTLEEPPEHVKFLFATTDPQKLPVTILSRCLQFNLKNMPAEKIVSHLSFVLSEEQIEYTTGALWLLARAAEGSMRDALSLTDQAISFCHSALHEAQVSEMLGTVDHGQTLRLIETLSTLNPRNLLMQINDIVQYSPDYKELLANIIDVLHRVALEQMVPGITENHLGDQEEIVRLAQALLVEDVQLWYQIALMGRKDLDLCPDRKAGFEMVLLRMLAFKPNVDSAEDLGERPPLPAQEPVTEESPSTVQEEQKKNSETLKSPEDVSQEPVQVSESTLHSDDSSAVASALATTHPAFESIPHDYPDMPEDADDFADETPSVNLPSPPAVAEPKLAVAEEKTENVDSLQAVQPSPDQNDVTESPFFWGEDYRNLGLAGMTLNLASNCAWVQSSPAVIELQVDPVTARLLTDNHKKNIREAILSQGTLPQEIEDVVFRECVPEVETPAKRRERLKEERRLQAVDVIYADPIVQSLVQQFEGTVVESSIEPID